MFVTTSRYDCCAVGKHLQATHPLACMPAPERHVYCNGGVVPERMQ